MSLSLTVYIIPDAIPFVNTFLKVFLKNFQIFSPVPDRPQTLENTE